MTSLSSVALKTLNVINEIAIDILKNITENNTNING
jgi:hypothetical protein